MANFIKSRRAWIIVAVILVVGVIGVFALGGRGGNETQAATTKAPPPLEFVAADLTYLTPRSLQQTLAVTGTLQATYQAVVKAKEAVDVKEILVREGDPVKAGQVLARLDTADLDARLSQQIGTRESARAQYELAEKNRNTNRALLDKSFISQNAFDSTDSSYRANRAALDAADAQVQLARNALRYATVVAPITGIVAKRHVQVGEKTAVDSPLFTIVDLDSIELQAMVPAGEVGGLTRGMPVTLTVDGMAGQQFTGKLDRVSPATEPGTRSIIVYMTVPNRDHILKSGMFANGVLQTGSSKALPSLPLSAVRSEAGQPVIWTIEDGKLTRRPIKVGRRDTASGLVEVTDGIQSGIPVLGAKFDNIKEGTAALVKADVPTAASASAATPAAPAASTAK